MVQLFDDTHPAAEQVLIDLMRAASPARKMHLVGEMNRTVRELALQGLRTRHPDDTPEQLRRRLADLLLGPDLAAKAYGPME